MEPVDFYCERVAPGLGGEPVNMATGLAFLLVGLWAFARAPADDDRRAALALALVGLASATQHGFAVSFTLVADMAANWLFLLALGVLLLRRLAGVGYAAAVPGAAAALAAALLIGYSPAARAALGLFSDTFALLALALALAAAVAARAQPSAARGLLGAALLLAVGLPFRFLDGALCADWPTGTHAVWHLFNAAAMALLLATLANPARGTPRAA